MDDTWLNPADKQIALFVINALVEFAEISEIQDATDGAFDPGLAMDMGKKFLKKHCILTSDEYAEEA